MKKMSNKLLLALGLSLAGVTGAMAQQQGAGADGAWSLEEAINYAIQNNLQVRQSQLNLDMAETDLMQSRFSRLPSLNGSASQNHNFGTYIDQTTYELRSEQNRTNSFQVGTSMPLFMGLQQVNRIKQDELEVQANQKDVQSAQNDIIVQVITSYLNVLFAEELIKTSELQRNTTNQQLSRTRILFDAGSVAENAVLDLESQLASDELSLINAQNQRDVSRVNLINLLNLDQAESFDIVIPEIPEPDQAPSLVSAAQVYDVAVQTLPAIQSVDLRVQSAAKGLDVARGAYYPRLNFNAGINTFYSSARDFRFPESGALEPRTLGFSDSEGTDPVVIYTPTTTFRSEEYPFFDQLKDGIGKQLGFTLQVPVFNGLQARANVQRAKIAQQNAKLNADIARNNLRQTIQQAYVDALAAQRKYIAAKEQVRAAEKNYQNAELRLNSGVINTVDFNIIANTYRSALSSLIQAKYEYTFKLKLLDFYQGKDISL